MRIHLLPEEGQFYKANLHCHTDLSDGNFSPEQVKELYGGMGYSIVAFTDHDVFIPHDELCDEHFLALNGFEVEINELEDARQGREGRSTHLCCLALEQSQRLQPCFHRTKYFFCNAQKNTARVMFDRTKPDYERSYTPECINEMIGIIKESGFFVTYNHPAWSLEDYSVYMSYCGFDAMEMYNGGSLTEGYLDCNPRVYDDLLRGGKRVFCVGGDDNHNYAERGTRRDEAGRAFTMIKASRLDYRSVTDALLRGAFYSSDGGPGIHSLYEENGRLHIACEAADAIRCTYSNRRAGMVYDETGEGICAASFPIERDSSYLRITVIGKDGKTSCTNAYFTDRL